LTPFKVAVGGGGAALSRLQDVGVHAQTHGAAGDPPVETCLYKDLVQTLVLGFFLDLGRARHDHGVDIVVDLLALDHLGGSP